MASPLHACLCCGSLTLPERPPGSYYICEVCGWEDDPVQAADPDYEGGANRGSLRTVRRQFLEWRVAGFPPDDRRRPPRPDQVGDL
jgi:hypothetical protein